MHSHNYARSDEAVARWVSTMDEVGLQKTIILSGATGDRFDEALEKYGKYRRRFEVWCGFDYTGLHEPGFGPAAVAELERCHRLGAKGVGELSDKGRGLGATQEKNGVHIDDPKLDVLLQKCAEFKMPINIHVAEDKWMYEPMDSQNDGLMNAWKWRVPNTPDVLQHDEVIETLERALKRHPNTTFIACHFANCCSDLNRLGKMLDAYPNLYADMGARFAEIAPIPRFMAAFLTKYQDRILYGTDMGPEPDMYRVTFRILETADEHFYPAYFNHYHWALHGFALEDGVLSKLYRDNAIRLLSK
jgi:predicted TIM-barrel fold metal-dependent hydrolase